MTLSECFTALGGNYDEVIGRLRSERIVRKFVLKFLTDDSFANLCRALEEGNGEEAFRAAHTIKGICQNLGFDRLYKSSSRLTEELRSGGKPEKTDLFRDVEADYQVTMAAIRRLQEEG